MRLLAFGLRALYLSAFLLLVGNAIQNIYIPSRALELGFSTFSIGLLGSCYFLGFVLGCLFVPKYLHQVGHVRTFAAFSSMAGAVALVFALSEASGIWIVLRLVTGFSLAGLYLSIESWISALSEDSNRGRIISTYRLTDLGGAVIGQMILYKASDFEGLFSVIALFFLISIVPITLTQMQTPILVQAAPEKLLSVFKKTFRQAPLSFWGALMSGVVAGVFWSLIPIFSSDLQLGDRITPLLVASYLIGGALTQWPVGVWSDRIDRRLVIMVLSVVALTSSVMITFGVQQGVLNLYGLMFLVGLFGAGSVPIYAISVAHAHDWMKKSSSVVDLSVLLLLSSSIGSVLGPLVVGTVIQSAGTKNFFLLISMTHVFLFLQSIYRMTQVSAMATEKKTEYLDLPETTPMIATVAEHIPKEK